MSFETNEERIQRLEYYIHQLRDYIVAPEKFLLWDWSISQRLNQGEIRSLISLAKDFDQKMKDSTEDQYPSLESFCLRIKELVYQGDRDGITIFVDNLFLKGFLNGLVSMGLFKTLTDHYLKYIK